MTNIPITTSEYGFVNLYYTNPIHFTEYDKIGKYLVDKFDFVRDYDTGVSLIILIEFNIASSYTSIRNHKELVEEAISEYLNYLFKESKNECE